MHAAEPQLKSCINLNKKVALNLKVLKLFQLQKYKRQTTYGSNLYTYRNCKGNTTEVDAIVVYIEMHFTVMSEFESLYLLYVQG